MTNKRTQPTITEVPVIGAFDFCVGFILIYLIVLKWLLMPGMEHQNINNAGRNA